ncbi:MAG: hypothetical protein ED559_08240 [Phycisphaera sp.]|nr:MAG: hypothetical protein ED559_08240 [Phycisphaera sp.]
MAVWHALQRTVLERADSGTASSFLQARLGHMMRMVCDMTKLSWHHLGHTAAPNNLGGEKDRTFLCDVKFSDEYCPVQIEANNHR